jgi:hypothetical protein
MPYGRRPVAGYYTRMRVIGLTTCLSALTLTSCASAPAKMPDLGPMIDHIPHWLGGEREGMPPRAGTPEHEAWQDKREGRAAIKGKGQPGEPFAGKGQ